MKEHTIEELSDKVLAFTRDRDWDQFHNPKDLAIAISIESAELLEAFLWKKPEEAKKEKVREELADIINYAILLADKCDLDIYEIVTEKLKVNEEKYPVDKAKGNSAKYDQL